MRTSPWTAEHDHLLADTTPTVAEPTDDELTRVWNRVDTTVAQAPRRRRGWRTALGVVAGAAVIGTSTVAAADLYSAHTGRGPVDAEDLRLGGPGEKLDLGAPDYGQVVAEVTADIPFPTESSRAVAVQAQVHDARFAIPGKEFVSTGAVRAWVAESSVCAWSNQWAVSTRTGNEDDRAEARLMLHEAPSWPAVTAIDPHPYSRMETGQVMGRDGTIRPFQSLDESQFYYLAELGRAARGTDISAVTAVLAADAHCVPDLVPDIPQANPMFGER